MQQDCQSPKENGGVGMYPAQGDIEQVREMLYRMVQIHGRVSPVALLWSRLLDHLIAAYMRRQDLTGSVTHFRILTLLGELTQLRRLVPTMATVSQWQQFMDDIFLRTLSSIDVLYRAGSLGHAEYALGVSTLHMLHSGLTPPARAQVSPKRLVLALRTSREPIYLGLAADALHVAGWHVQMVGSPALQAGIGEAFRPDLTLLAATHHVPLGNTLRTAHALYERYGRSVVVCGPALRSDLPRVPAYLRLMSHTRMSDMMAFVETLVADVIHLEA